MNQIQIGNWTLTPHPDPFGPGEWQVSGLEHLPGCSRGANEIGWGPGVAMIWVPIFRGRNIWKQTLIDVCIAPLVDSLINQGYWTLACCCRHGDEVPRVMFKERGSIPDEMLACRPSYAAHPSQPETIAAYFCVKCRTMVIDLDMDKGCNCGK